MYSVLGLVLVCAMVVCGCSMKQNTGQAAEKPQASFMTTKVWIESGMNESVAESPQTLEVDMAATNRENRFRSFGLGTVVSLVTPFLESVVDHGYDALVNYIQSKKAKYSATFNGIGSNRICYGEGGKVLNQDMTLHLEHGAFGTESNEIRFAMSFKADFLTNHIRIKPISLEFNKASAYKADDDKDFAVSVELLTYTMADDGAVKAQPFASYKYLLSKVPLGAKFGEAALGNMESQYMILPTSPGEKPLCYPIAAKISVIETEDVPVLLDIIAKSAEDSKTETKTELKSVLKEILKELKKDDE